jgi:hypothetical protein
MTGHLMHEPGAATLLEIVLRPQADYRAVASEGVLSSSYFTGTPPWGISIRTLISIGGFRPGGILLTSMAAPQTLSK